MFFFFFLSLLACIEHYATIASAMILALDLLLRIEISALSVTHLKLVVLWWTTTFENNAVYKLKKKNKSTYSTEMSLVVGNLIYCSYPQKCQSQSLHSVLSFIPIWSCQTKHVDDRHC